MPGASELDPLERDEFRREPGRATVAVTPPEGELPGGTASGSMLHEILEMIPFDSLDPDAEIRGLATSCKESPRSSTRRWTATGST